MPQYSSQNGAFYIESQSGLQLVTDPTTLEGLESGSIPTDSNAPSDTTVDPSGGSTYGSATSGGQTQSPYDLFNLGVLDMLRTAQQGTGVAQSNLNAQNVALGQASANTTINPQLMGNTGGNPGQPTPLPGAAGNSGTAYAYNQTLINPLTGQYDTGMQGLSPSQQSSIQGAQAGMYNSEQNVITQAQTNTSQRLQDFNALASNLEGSAKTIVDQMTPPQDIINGYIEQIRFGQMPSNLTTGAQAAIAAAIGNDPTIMQEYYNAVISGKNLQPFTPGQSQASGSSSVVTNVLKDAGLGFLGNANMATAANTVPGFAQTLANQLISNQGSIPGLDKMNNPGAIKFNNLPGQTDSGIQAQDGGTYAKYATPEAGQAAVLALVNNAINSGKNLEDFVASYMGVPAPTQNTSAPNGGSFGGTTSSGVPSILPKQLAQVNKVQSQLTPDNKSFNAVQDAYNNIQSIPNDTNDPLQQKQLLIYIAEMTQPSATSVRYLLTNYQPQQLISGLQNTFDNAESLVNAAGNAKLTSSQIANLKSTAEGIYKNQQQDQLQAFNEYIAPLKNMSPPMTDAQIIQNFPEFANLLQSQGQEGTSKQSSMSGTTPSGLTYTITP